MSNDAFSNLKQPKNWWKEFWSASDINELNDESIERVNKAHSLLIQVPGLERVDLIEFQEDFLEEFKKANEKFGNSKHNDAFIVRALYNFMYALSYGKIDPLEKAEEIVKNLGPTRMEQDEAKFQKRIEKIHAFGEKPIPKFFFLYLNTAIMLTLESLFCWSWTHGEKLVVYAFTFWILYYPVFLFSSAIMYRHKNWYLPYLFSVISLPVILATILFHEDIFNLFNLFN